MWDVDLLYAGVLASLSKFKPRSFAIAAGCCDPLRANLFFGNFDTVPTVSTNFFFSFSNSLLNFANNVVRGFQINVVPC